MKSANPYDRNTLEVRVMAFLNDLPHSHPITLDELVDAIDRVRKDSVICTVGDLRDDGILELTPLRDGQLVRILPLGKHVLTKIYAGQNGC